MAVVCCSFVDRSPVNELALWKETHTALRPSRRAGTYGVGVVDSNTTANATDHCSPSLRSLAPSFLPLLYVHTFSLHSTTAADAVSAALETSARAASSQSNSGRQPSLFLSFLSAPPRWRHRERGRSRRTASARERTERRAGSSTRTWNFKNLRDRIDTLLNILDTSRTKRTSL